MKKRIISLMVSVAMLGTLVTGCGESGGEDVTPEGTEAVGGVNTGLNMELDSGEVELRVWSEAGNFDVLNKMFDSFKQEYGGQANFTITLEEYADSETKNNVLGDVHAAADVFPMADDQLASMVAGGAVCAVPNADEIAAQNLEGAVDAASVNGVLYAYPYSADNGYFLYYNKKYLSEADVQTMDGLLAAAEKAGKKVTMDWGSGWYNYAFWGNTGLEFGINDDGVTNHCNWNDPKGVDVAKAMLDIAKSPAFVNGGDAVFSEGMANDTVIAGVSGVWEASDVESNWGSDYGAVKLPTYTLAGQQVQMSSFKGYKMYGVNSYSKHLGWALKLAEWLSNEQNQVLRFEERSQGPSNKNAAASDAVGKVPAIKAVQEQAEFGVLQRVGNSYWTPTSDFGNAMGAGNPNGLELQDLLDTMVTGITASVAN